MGGRLDVGHVHDQSSPVPVPGQRGHRRAGGTLDPHGRCDFLEGLAEEDAAHDHGGYGSCCGLGQNRWTGYLAIITFYLPRLAEDGGKDSLLVKAVHRGERCHWRSLFFSVDSFTIFILYRVVNK